MEWLVKQVRQEIWDLAPYVSARSELSDATNLVALDANENPWIPYPQTPIMDKVNRYPEPQPFELVSRLANLYQVNPKQVFVGRGMDEGIELLIRIFCIPYQDNIVTLMPTFSYYKVAATISGVETRELALSAAPKFDFAVEQLLNLCDENTKIIFLCTPNNPTGQIIPLDIIELILQDQPQLIIAVDEAYLEFSEHKSALSLMSKYSNLVVMKTMSKAFAFAGVRIGCVIAQTPIIKLLHKVMPPYPLAEPCINLAVQTLSAHGLYLAKQRIELLKQERQRVIQHLLQLDNLEVYPSEANFVLIKVADAKACYQHLLAQGIVVRNRHQDITNTLRITIGDPEQNNLFLAAMGAFKLPIQTKRHSTFIRNTNETKIILELDLTSAKLIKINTGIGFFDHMLEQLAKHGGFSLQLMVIGDTHIDFHHSVEDVAISLGQALRQVLGDKRGINRYGSYCLPMDECLAQAQIDLSGRGVLVYQANYQTPLIGNFPVELVEHFFYSLAQELGASIHLQVSNGNAHHQVEGLFKACARALAQAIAYNGTNVLPSTKGVL